MRVCFMQHGMAPLHFAVSARLCQPSSSSSSAAAAGLASASGSGEWKAQAECVALLLDAGADVHAQDTVCAHRGLFTLWLHIILYRHPVHRCHHHRRKYLSKYVNYYGTRQGGRSPLLLAVEFGVRRAVLQLLFAHGADCNTPDEVRDPSYNACIDCFFSCQSIGCRLSVSFTIHIYTLSCICGIISSLII